MTTPRWKFGIALGIMLAALSWLAYTGVRESKSYYVTVSQLKTMPHAHSRRLRVAGTVVPGSIQHKGENDVEFTLLEGGQKLDVAYIGTDPLPDTFVGNAQAVAAGRLLRDGSFRATGVQAKCASKYEPKGVRQPGAVAPTTSAGTM